MSLPNKIKPATLGVIIGNRDFFPDQLVAEAREDMLHFFPSGTASGDGGHG